MPTDNIQKAIQYVKGQLGITSTTQDTLIENMIKAANAKIFSLTKINLLNETEELTDILDGAGQRTIYTKLRPIDEVTAVSQNTGSQTNPVWQAYDIDNISRDEMGSVVAIDGCYPRGYKNIKIEYTALWFAWDSIPEQYEDLKNALAMMCGNLLAVRKQSGIKSESVSGTSLTYDKSVMSDDVKQIVSQYKFFAT